MADLQARDGKMGLAWLIEPDTTETASGSLSKGTICFISAKASSSSVFGDDAVIGSPFFAVKDTTLATGDKCYKCTPKFLGFATGKSVSYSKETSEITCDYDVALGKKNYAISPDVDISGSISGMNLLSKDTDSAINIIKSRFGGMTMISADGEATTKAANTTEKDIILIIWNFKEVKATGDVYDMEVLPVLFTSLSKGSEYGSPQNFDLDFTSVATDENNFAGGNLQVAYASGLFGGDWKTTRD